MPYIRRLTDEIGTVLMKFSTAAVFTPEVKVHNIYTHNTNIYKGKQKDALSLQTLGLHKINCSCGYSYKGRTKRPIAK